MITSPVGIAVAMPRQCPRCYGHTATIGAGCGPHAASLVCACGRHLGWMSKASYDFIAETVRLFGRPTKPIQIQIRAPARMTAPLGADAVPSPAP
jgi:hypothetical protein